jgi:alpha-methylacyl-CoA racemase
LFLVIGILSALFETQQSGKGQVIDTAITDGSAHLMSMFYTMNKLGAYNAKRQSNMLDGGVPYYDSYQTADDKFISVGPIEPKFFAEMINKAGLPDSFIEHQNNPQKWPEIKATMADTFKTKTRDQWAEIFEGTDACVAGIYDLHEAVLHPHNQSRGTYLKINDTDQPAPAPRFSRTQCEVPAAPPKEGADTTQVLADWGFDEGEIQRLNEAGILT